jgi:hypothetical protein
VAVAMPVVTTRLREVLERVAALARLRVLRERLLVPDHHDNDGRRVVPGLVCAGLLVRLRRRPVRDRLNGVLALLARVPNGRRLRSRPVPVDDRLDREPDGQRPRVNRTAPGRVRHPVLPIPYARSAWWRVAPVVERDDGRVGGQHRVVTRDHAHRRAIHDWRSAARPGAADRHRRTERTARVGREVDAAGRCVPLRASPRMSPSRVSVPALDHEGRGSSRTRVHDRPLTADCCRLAVITGDSRLGVAGVKRHGPRTENSDNEADEAPTLPPVRTAGRRNRSGRHESS